MVRMVAQALEQNDGWQKRVTEQQTAGMIYPRKANQSCSERTVDSWRLGRVQLPFLFLHRTRIAKGELPH